MRFRVLFVLSAALVVAAPAAAQTKPEAGPFLTVLGGGLSVPLGDQADALELGGGVQFALGWYVGDAFSARLEYQYSGWGIDEEEIGVEDVSGNFGAHSIDANASWDFLTKQAFGVYAIGGPSLVYRRLSIERQEGVTLTPFCQPAILICIPGATPLTETIAEADAWDFGLNVGLGARYRLYPGIELFVEGRYRYVFGETFTDESGEERDSDAAWLPVFAGLRVRAL